MKEFQKKKKIQSNEREKSYRSLTQEIVWVQRRSSWSSRIANVLPESRSDRRERNERKKERLSSIHNTTRWGTGSLVALSGDRKVARRNETAPRWLRGGIPVPREPYARQKRCRTRLRSLPHWYHPQYLSRSPDGDACLLHASPQPLLRYRFLQTPLIARRLKESFECMR